MDEHLLYQFSSKFHILNTWNHIWNSDQCVFECDSGVCYIQLLVCKNFIYDHFKSCYFRHLFRNLHSHIFKYHANPKSTFKNNQGLTWYIPPLSQWFNNQIHKIVLKLVFSLLTYTRFCSYYSRSYHLLHSPCKFFVLEIWFLLYVDQYHSHWNDAWVMFPLSFSI